MKNLPANAGDTRDLGSILGSGRPPRKGNGNPLQYSCLENPMDWRNCWATVYGITKNRIWLSAHAYTHTHTHTHTHPCLHLEQFDMLVHPCLVPVFTSHYLCACSVMSNSLQLWSVTHQAPLSMEFPRQEYWSGLPFPPSGDLLNPGIEPMSPVCISCNGRQILYQLIQLGSQ